MQNNGHTETCNNNCSDFLNHQSRTDKKQTDGRRKPIVLLFN